ncbi:MAG: hypothetical protein DMF92_07730 [Acidobacteria bacterium]|nr:MAG: hypothetical protein DMF92_07730 [Acidobacteriota bacterium]
MSIKYCSGRVGLGLATIVVALVGVSDYTYSRALAKFGEPGIVEAAHIAGLSTMMAMIMNAVRVQARIPEGSKPPLAPYPHTLPVPTIGRQSQ